MMGLTGWLSAWALLFTGGAVIMGSGGDVRWIPFTMVAATLWVIFVHSKRSDARIDRMVDENMARAKAQEQHDNGGER